MMDLPLNAWLLFRNAARHHPQVEIVSRRDGASERITYADFSARAQQLMHALDDLGIAPGAHVSTLAWNHAGHLEAYFAIPCTGRVIHTANIRLSPDDLAYVLGHAEARALLVDAEFLPVIEQVAAQLPLLEHIVVFGATVPPTTLTNVIAYETLLAGKPTHYDAPDIAESTPLGLCYTSGTTGRPKGVVYTHRSTFLHALAVTSGAAMSIGPSDTVLPQVPMFHASAWGMPYASVAVGAKLVFYAGALDARHGMTDILKHYRARFEEETAAEATEKQSVASRLLPIFKGRYMRKGLMEPLTFLVRAPFEVHPNGTESEPEQELLWVEVVQWDEDNLVGKLVEGGTRSTEWRKGSHVEVDDSQINALAVAREGRQLEPEEMEQLLQLERPA